MCWRVSGAGLPRRNNTVIPHVTNAIKEFVLSDLTDEDFVLCEIGGTVGDINRCRSSKPSASWGMSWGGPNPASCM